jgi:hypothetical protein
MDYDLEWTEPAIESLEEILQYIAQENAPPQTDLEGELTKRLSFFANCRCLEQRIQSAGQECTAKHARVTIASFTA